MPTQNQPLVSIAINSYKSPALIRLALLALKKHLAQVDFTYELLLVDSATEEETEMLMREDFPEVRFFPFQKNVGYGKLINQSVEVARGEYLFCINADIIVEHETLPSLLAFAKDHPEIGLIGPKQLNFDGSLQESCLRYYRPMTILYRRTWLKHTSRGKRHLYWFTMKDYDHREPKMVDWLTGSALFFRTEVAKRVGPLDARFFMYMEDVDWCRRFWELGLKVCYYPASVVYHYHAKGSARGGFLLSLLMNRLTWYHIGSALKYFMKYRGKPLPRIE